MSTDRDTTRIVRSWLEEGVTALPDRVLDTVLDQVPATPQRRPWWSTRRFDYVNKYAQAAIAAAAVLVVAVVGYNLLARSAGPGELVTPAPTTQPTPASTAVQTPSPSPTPSATSSLAKVTVKPFGPGGFGDPEDPGDDAMAYTVSVPAGWKALESVFFALKAEGSEAPSGASLLITRGGWLFSEPCLTEGEQQADVPVGATVADLATALDAHPLLAVTTPVDVTLAGYSGKYLEIQVPADISGCARYRPIDGTIHAQGPSHLWHYWILDVDGIRVVIGSHDFPGTSAQHKAELKAMVESIQITP